MTPDESDLEGTHSGLHSATAVSDGKVHASIMHILRKPEAGTNTTYNSDMSHSPAIAFLFSRLK